MPLNEDVLPDNHPMLLKFREIIQRHVGIQCRDMTEELVKAAYSPEVLQALGVEVVPTEPTDDMVIAFAEEWYCQKQAIDDVKMDEAYKAMIAASPYAIKEQS